MATKTGGEAGERGSGWEEVSRIMSAWEPWNWGRRYLRPGMNPPTLFMAETWLGLEVLPLANIAIDFELAQRTLYLIEQPHPQPHPIESLNVLTATSKAKVFKANIPPVCLQKLEDKIKLPLFFIFACQTSLVKLPRGWIPARLMPIDDSRNTRVPIRIIGHHDIAAM